MAVKYPRTPHLPWSPGASADDVRAASLAALEGREVVVTEKLDGENTTLYRDRLHARSLDSAHHPSRTVVKALHARIRHHIPEGWRVCGENLQARHSIPYDALDGLFYAFGVWCGDTCFGWDDTAAFARDLGLPVPRVLWRGTFDERALRALSVPTDAVEGYVVRDAGSFGRAAFAHRVAKWVRADHVQSDAHWMQRPVVPNGLGPEAPLWELRSGGSVRPDALADLLGPGSAAGLARLGAVDRLGERRLEACLAGWFAGRRRSELLPELATPLGMPTARRVADLVGLARRLHARVPDDTRVGGLVSLARCADLGALHLAALHTAPDPDAAEQVAWSQLVAEDAGLLGPDPLDGWVSALRTAIEAGGAELDADRWAWVRGVALADRAAGRGETPPAAAARAWARARADVRRVFVLVGPSGSGKSRVARGLLGVRVSLDDLRSAGVSEDDVLARGLGQLAATLATGDAIWDATSLTRTQRRLVLQRAGDVLTTLVAVVAPREVVEARNRSRAARVPDAVVARQYRRLDWPYAFEAHRIWWVGADGSIAARVPP